MDGNLGRQFVWQIVQLPSAAYRHQDTGGPFLDCNFNDSDRVEDVLDGTAQVQTSGDSETALDALLEQG